jgi:hypothetical protein
MVLQMLKYLKMADIQDDSIHYLWDDFGDQPEELFDEEFITLLDSLSQRAILAFMCGSAEWIVHRLRIYVMIQGRLNLLKPLGRWSLM